MRARLPTLAAAAFSLLLTACGPPRVSLEEAEEAFVAAFGGAYIGSFFVQLGQELNGVVLNDETDTMEFDGFRIADLGTRYTELSGAARTTATSLLGDFTLLEGPVETIRFELSVEQMRAETIEATVIANGRPVAISITSGRESYVPAR